MRPIIIIERVITKTLRNPGGIECNDNNNPKRDDIKDLDYNEQIKKTYLDNYIDMIDYPYSMVYELSEAEAGVLIDAIPISFYTRQPNMLYTDELETIIQRMELDIGNDFAKIKSGWFFRMSPCSSKDGIHYLRPITTIRQVVEQLSSSKRTVTALIKGYRKIYFTPFDLDWEECRELRVFVRNGKITCISQYVWFKYALFSSLTDNDLTILAQNVIDYLYEKLPPILKKIRTSDVVCDVYWNTDDTIRIIELNSFGYWMGSGAACFHWINDYDKLYGGSGGGGGGGGGGDTVYFRVHQ